MSPDSQLAMATPGIADTSPDISPQQWRAGMAQFASGVTVITTLDSQGMPTGTTVSAFCSLSLSPMLLLVSLDKRSNTLSSLLTQGVFAVNILSQPQQSVAFQCGSRDKGKFSQIPHTMSRYGLPLIDGCIAHIECKVHQSIEGGDHNIIIGEPLSLVSYPDVSPMIYHQGRFI